MHPSITDIALIAYFSTSGISNTKRTLLLGSRVWVQIYVARHLKDQDFCVGPAVVVELTQNRKADEMDSKLSGLTDLNLQTSFAA